MHFYIVPGFPAFTVSALEVRYHQAGFTESWHFGILGNLMDVTADPEFHGFKGTGSVPSGLGPMDRAKDPLLVWGKWQTLIPAGISQACAERG